MAKPGLTGIVQSKQAARPAIIFQFCKQPLVKVQGFTTWYSPVTFALQH